MVCGPVFLILFEQSSDQGFGVGGRRARGAVHIKRIFPQTLHPVAQELFRKGIARGAVLRAEDDGGQHVGLPFGVLCLHGGYKAGAGHVGRAGLEAYHAGQIEQQGSREEIYPRLIGTASAQDACSKLMKE